MNQLGLVAISLVLVVSSYDVITSAAQASDDCKLNNNVIYTNYLRYPALLCVMSDASSTY
jgi:hypothetical protein